MLKFHWSQSNGFKRWLFQRYVFSLFSWSPSNTRTNSEEQLVLEIHFLSKPYSKSQSVTKESMVSLYFLTTLFNLKTWLVKT